MASSESTIEKGPLEAQFSNQTSRQEHRDKMMMVRTSSSLMVRSQFQLQERHIHQIEANMNKADYYDSGQFGDAICEHCGALLLKGENERIKSGRLSQCCASGDVNTEQMKEEYTELQTPPADYTKGLIKAKSEKLRETFLANTMAFNNTFAFASVHGEKAPDDQMGGRLDTCKYNGEFSFQFSDLIAPGGRRPTFAQVYTLTPEAAMNLRDENFDAKLSAPIKSEIVRKLEELMRTNPYGRTFETVGTKIEAAKTATGEIPRFQIALLTDRDLKTDAIKNRGDVTIIERADAPTAKQVAVIWVQEDGLAPEISAFWVCDKAGKMRALKSGMPQLDPCCFPLLHPRGTPGWRWFIKKRGRLLTREEHEQIEMQNTLDNAMGEEVAAPMPNEADVGAYVHQEDEVMPEEALVLDEDVLEEEENEAGREDPVMEHENDVESRSRSNISERQFYRYRMALRSNDKNSFHWLWFARRLAEYFTISVLNRIERNEMDHLKAIQTKRNYRQLLAREYIAAMEKGLQKWGPSAKLGRVFLMPQTFAGSRQYYQGKYADLMTMVRHLGAPTWFVTFTGNPKWPEIVEALQGRQNYVHRADIVCRIFMDKATEFIKDLTERNVLGKVAGWCYSVEHQKRGMPHIHMLLILDEGSRITTPEQVNEYVSARIPALPPIADQSAEAKQQRRLWQYVTTMMLHDCNAACLDGSKCRKHFPKRSVIRTMFVYHQKTATNGISQGVETKTKQWTTIIFQPTIQKEGFEKAYVQVTQPTRGAKSGDGANVYDYDEIAATFKVRYMTAMEAYLRLHSYKIVQTSHQIYALSVHDEGGRTIVVEEGHEEEGFNRLARDTRLTGFFKLCAADSFARTLRYDQIPYYYSWNERNRFWVKRKYPKMERIAGAKMFVRVYTVSPRRRELFAIRCLLLHRSGPQSFDALRTVDGELCPSFTVAAERLGLLACDAIFAGAMRDACVELTGKKLQRYFAMLIHHGGPSNPQQLFDDFLDEMNPSFAPNNPSINPKSVEVRRAEVMRNLEYFFNCMGTTSGDVGLQGLPKDYDFQQQEQILEEDNIWDEFYGNENARRKTPQQIALANIGRLNIDQRDAFDQISSAILSVDGQRLFFLEGAGGCGKTFLYNTLIKWCYAGKPSLDGSVETEWGREKEVSMLSSRVLKYIDRLLRDVCGAAKPFGGNLNINMRTAPGEQALRNWLLTIGNGQHQTETNNQECGSNSNLLQIPEQNLAHDMEDVINFCFPSALFNSPLENANAIADNAILCPTNNDVQYINNLALDRMSGNATDYMSIDEPLETVEDNNTFRADFNMEAVHNEMPSGIPPHKLKLKVGTPIMLLRNLDVHQGLCNGTRLQVMRMSDDNLFCRILTGPRADVNQTIVLPRIKFEYGRGRNHRGLRFQRLQFPVRACFAMTVNKAQGQTLQRMALVLRGKQCFAHGQVYVAMSRVTRMDGIRVYAPSCQSGDYSYIANVVYHELLDVHIPPRPQHSALTEATHEQEEVVNRRAQIDGVAETPKKLLAPVFKTALPFNADPVGVWSGRSGKTLPQYPCGLLISDRMALEHLSQHNAKDEKVPKNDLFLALFFDHPSLFELYLRGE
uniref:ATP-dependent DNA helicase n=1 Tax=Globodera pallida TaxID=36090 RepID=A0A183C066_GLOPA